MWLIDLEAAPPRLRGFLSRWGVEVRAGLYLGSTGARVRDAIWELVVGSLGAEGNAVLAYDARNVQGFEVRTAGANRRDVVDVDGLWLAKFKPLTKDGDGDVPSIVPDDIDDVDAAYEEPPS